MVWEWNILDHKITNNGSNMVKAFKLLQQQVNPDAANEDNEYDVNELSTMMSDSDIPDLVDTSHTTQSEEEEEEEDLEEEGEDLERI